MQNFTKFLYLALCLLWLPTALSAQTATFEQWSDEHTFSGSNWSSEGFTPNSYSTPLGFDDGRAKVDNSQKKSGSKSLRIKFPNGKAGTSDSGVNFPLSFTGRNEKYMSYWMRFDGGFDWGGDSDPVYEGGKLPGFAGGSFCSGGSSCSGTNGFTSRLMWRNGGRGVLYLYHMDKPGTYGDDIQLKKSDGSNYFFPKGQWVHVAMRVKMNTVSNGSANYNGVVQVWINGTRMHSRTNYRFRTNGNKVDNLFFSTFHGGSGSEWAPSRDNYIWFDEVKLGNSYDDVKTGDSSGGGGGGATSNRWIYRNGFYSGWSNWSWGGDATVKDSGVKKVGSHSFKFIARNNGAAASMRHNNGFDVSNLNSVRFWARSWNNNYNGKFQARYSDSQGGGLRNIRVTPTWKQYTIAKSDIGTNYIKRLIWRIPRNRTIWLDDVRLVYKSSSLGEVSQSVSAELSQEEITGFSVAPNPNAGEFTVAFKADSDREDVTITLHDMTGRLADQTKVLVTAGANQFRMDYRSSQLPTGVYLLRVASADGRLSHVKRVSIR